MKRALLILALFFSLVGSSLAASRTSIATDNFNRAAPLGANWQTVNTSLGSTATICTSTTVCGTSGVSGPPNGATYVWVGSGTFTDNQYSKITFANASFGSVNYGIGIVCRASTDTDAGRDYYYHFADSTGGSSFGKVVNGTHTSITTGSPGWSNGDTIELECLGTAITAMKNGVSLGGSFAATDSSLTTGAPGLIATGDGGVATGDDWDGGSLVAGGGGGATDAFSRRRSQ